MQPQVGENPGTNRVPKDLVHVWGIIGSHVCSVVRVDRMRIEGPGRVGSWH